jgi:hypothetical protein
MDTNIQIREVQVSYQPLKGKLFQLKSADNAFEYLSRAYDEGTIGLCEEFMVLLLNRANRVMGCLRLSKGAVMGWFSNIYCSFVSLLLFPLEIHKTPAIIDNIFPHQGIANRK